MQFGSISIEKIVHAGFRISGKDGVVYIDPWKVSDASMKADLVLITHDHFDHFSLEDIKKILKEGTVVVGNSNVKEGMEGLSGVDFREVAAGQNLKVGKLTVKAFPSYNVNKFREGNEVYHPKSAGNVGYILGIDKTIIFHPGDTDNIEEFEQLSVTGIKIAFFPVSGTYVMTWQEAVEACKMISPDIAIPMHWGEIVGTSEDAENFKKNVPCRVEIL